MSLDQAESIALEPRREDAAPSYLESVLKIVRTEAFFIGSLFFVALALCFWPLFKRLPSDWFGTDTYYNHGPLIPVMAGYLIFDRWAKIKQIPVRPFYWAIVPIGFLMYANYVAISSPRALFMSVMMVITIGLGVWFVAGGRWLKALTVPILFLLFGLPIWETVIDVYTQPMQNVSTDLAFAMIKSFGFEAMRVDDTTIMLNRFSLFVGVPCSGLRMIMAMAALTVFCIFIGRMKWWANVALAALAFPVCVFVNSFRIALIGIVGQTWGDDAGHQFHDTSGYISILLLVVILWQITKLLGMNKNEA